MHENKLLASVALFRELYDRDKDIYDVIGALLKAAISFEKKWAFNATEATQLLDVTFGFKIPEAVVKTTLRNRLKRKEKLLTFKDGVYSLTSKDLKDATLLSCKLKSTKERQDQIINDLCSYIEEHSQGPINVQERTAIVDSFCAYLLDSDATNDYSGLISSYIIERQTRQGFTDSLNAVREGFVLYNGVRYSSDLNDLGSWKTNLTVYLDTEHLFNLASYNGVLFKQIFDDWFDLIKEVNKSGKQFITVKYFEECEEEIEKFFHVAELIIVGKASLDPSKTAMLYILDGSETKSDIVEKKAHLYSQLKRKRITLETKNSFYDKPEYVVEGKNLLDGLKSQAERNGWYFDEEKYIRILKMFTKINVLRRGMNSGSFEKIGFILMSGKSISHYLAFNPLVKTDDIEIPFATDIEFFTNRLWFKLKKGLADHASLPKSLDVVAKAQVVLSSQINTSISDKYDSLKKKLAKGDITKEDAEYINHVLRSRAVVPEDITPDNIESSLDFLSHDNYEVHLREKSILEKKAAEGNIAVQKIAEIEQKEHEKKKRRRVLKAKAQLGLFWFVFATIIVCCYGLCFYLIYSFRGAEDSALAAFGIMISLIFGTIPLIGLGKIKERFSKKYIEIIRGS